MKLFFIFAFPKSNFNFDAIKNKIFRIIIGAFSF